MKAQAEAKPYDDINITPMLDLAYVEEWRGNLTDAEKYYLTGLAAFDQQLSTGGKAAQIIIPAPGTFYRGDQFEQLVNRLGSTVVVR